MIRLRNLVVLVAAVGLAASAAAQTPAVSPKAKAAVEGFLARIAKFEADQAALPPPASLQENLARRIRLDQAVRTDPWNEGLSRAEVDASMAPVIAKWREIDGDNTEWLKTVLPADGWFKISRDGEEVASNAFLIVQHSPDPDFQRTVLQRIEPLLKDREASPQSYALLYDRVTLRETGKQRYGSQFGCQDGKPSPAPMDEPEKVQERRDAIGFTVPRFADYQKMFETMLC